MGPKANDVREILTKLRGLGMNAGFRDVSYAVLSRIYEEPELAYRCVFGDSPELTFEAYHAQAYVASVGASVAEFFREEETPADGAGEEVETVSFDDLKKGLIEDMRSLEKLRDSTNMEGGPILDAKEMAQVVARIADIRVKLTEKFNTTERVVEQRVVVEQKFSSVCPWCHHEIAVDPSLFEKN